MNERVIFDAALEIADPQARRAFIEKACAGKPEMLAGVAALLKSHDAAGSFLSVPVAEQMRSDSSQPSDTSSKFVADAACVRQQLQHQFKPTLAASATRTKLGAIKPVMRTTKPTRLRPI